MPGSPSFPQRSAPRSKSKALLWIGLGIFLLNGMTKAGDILRGGAPAKSSAGISGTASPGGAGTPAVALPSAQDRLARTTQALAAVRQMQAAARQLAISGSNSLRAGLPAVPVNSYGLPNGLVLAPGVPKNLSNPGVGENSSLWTGANLPTVTTSSTDDTASTTVSITQTQQQAILNWQSFNIGKNTTLSFDQSAGGVNAGQWIAFNYVRDPTGVPSQILGAIKTVGLPDAQGHEQVGGQVYVMNANGIIFGGSSQVNVHGLVASSLPINYNLIQRGLLNNPDAQFQFSALPQSAGSNGPTSAFDPATASPDGLAPVQTPYAADGSGGVGNYGDVVVQPGASLTAPTTTDHVGGRIALIGPNVTNAGTISTADGQTILAAGLQVGLTAHNSADPTLRGLDVFVGKVADDSLPDQPTAGSAINAGLDAASLGVTTSGFDTAATNPTNINALGLISAPRGSVYITGRTVEQSGVIDSSTSVAYNGRVDLVAGFNAVANPKYDPSLVGQGDFTTSLPFYYQSFVGNVSTGAPVENSGAVSLGADSVTQILPETASTDRVVGDLVLPSQVNIQGQSVHFGANAILLAPSAAAPINPAFGADGMALGAGVTVRAGSWFNPGNQLYRFVQSDDAQQIYFDQGAAIDVSGLTNVSASVTENIIPVELRGTELAGSPLQRDGPLRGQTIQVDVRQHGPWDPTLNGGLGGYTWVGTPLADTSGWVGLTTHTVAELSTNGGSVSLKAGGALVLQPGAVIDVSGGSTQYAGGYTHTTKLLSGGHIYDISQAPSNLAYTGIYTGVSTAFDPKWGISVSTFNSLVAGSYENGYVQGGSGGSLAVTAPVLALDGTLRGNTVAGPQQRNLSPLYNPAAPPDPSHPAATGLPNWLIGAVSRPLPSQLAITVDREYESTTGTTDYLNYSPTPANIVFRDGANPAAVEAFRPAGDYLFPLQRNYEVDLSPSLVDNQNGFGFGALRIDNSDDNLGASTGYGNITVARGTAVTLDPGGSITLSAANIAFEDNALGGSPSGIQAPAGSIVLNAYDLSPSLAAYAAGLNALDGTGTRLLTFDASRGNVIVGAGATLNTAGQRVDDRPMSPTAYAAPLTTSGGSISLNGNSIVFGDGAILDVSGGGSYGANGKLTYGNAGSLTLMAGRALGGNIGAVLGGYLDLGGATLRGFTGIGKKGGSFTVQAPAIALETLDDGMRAATDPATGTLFLAPDFFNQGGFSTFTLTGLGFALDSSGAMATAAPAMTVTQGTRVQPVVQNWVNLPAGPTAAAPVGVREAAKLNLKSSTLLTDATGTLLNNDASLVIADDASVATDPGGTIALSGGTIDVLGGLTAQGGVITLNQLAGGGALYLPNIHLGSSSVLDASGATVFTQDIAGYHASDVLDGGIISVSGNIVAERGAELDVSGSSGTILAAPANPTGDSSLRPGAILVPTVRNSNGGTISLFGQQLMFTAATLLGGAGAPAAGGPTYAHGGALVISSNRAAFPLANSSASPALTDPMLILTAATPTFEYQGLAQQVTDAAGDDYGDAKGLGLTWFGTDSLTGAGFGALTFSVGQGALQVQGNVSLSAARQITFADSGVLSFSPDPATARSVLTLSAPYVVLGRPFLGPLQPSEASTPLGQNVAPVYGNGVLAVQASSLIDVGNLVLLGAGTATLDATSSGATNGAIRGDGTLDVAGAITLRAGQVYPPSAVTFNVVASDYLLNGAVAAGSVTVQSAGNSAAPSLPLSAGGTLNISASIIDQAGVLRAPLGTINLGASGGTDPLSGQKLPATSTLTLEPGSVTSVSAVDPATGKALTVPYGIVVNGDTWLDPTGANITNVGPAAKSVTLTAGNIDLQAGKAGGPNDATIDLSGGGDLYAYQFVPGAGGKNDILFGAAGGGFAIIPGYQDSYAPYAAYDSQTNAQISLGSDPGYVDSASNYHVGDRIHLAGVAGLPAGDYTLLPARYATLPGAYLVTPRATPATAGGAKAVTLPDGSSLVSGYRFNGFDQAGTVQPLFGSFEVASQSVVLKRAEYDSFLGNTFFAGVAQQNAVAVPRLSVDAGQLLLAARQTLNLKGTIDALAPTKSDGTPLGRGGLIDISTPQDILIAGPNTPLDPASSQLVLDSSDLSSFGEESLLIGGYRTFGANGTTVNVTTNSVLVDNGPAVNASGDVTAAGPTLSGSDVILVANRAVVIGRNATVEQKGTLPGSADVLNLAGSVTLQPGEAVGFSRGGVPISFPQGASFTATSSGTATTATGATQKFAAGAAVTLAAGSTYVFDPIDPAVGASLTLASSGAPITMVTGDGAALRVGSDPSARINRPNVALTTLASTTGVAGSTDPFSAPGVVLLPGATVSGGSGSLIIDSTNLARIVTDPVSGAAPMLSGRAITFGSRGISVAFSGSAGTEGSLILSAAALQQLQNNGAGLVSTRSLSLVSYGALDLYGSGTVGGAGLQNLSLHAAQIINQDGGAGVFQAANILLDNSSGGLVSAAAPAAPAGTVTFQAIDATGRAGTLQIGSGSASAPLTFSHFDTVALTAGSGVLFAGGGGLNVLGSDAAGDARANLTIDAPVITAAAGAQQMIVAGGDLAFKSSGSAPTTALEGGLGANLTFQANSIAADSRLSLPSGTLSLHAGGGDVTVGGTLDVSGQAKVFDDVVKYTGGGQVNLTSDAGAIVVSGTVDVSAPLDLIKQDGVSRVGSAGAINVSAIDTSEASDGGSSGRFVVTGSLKGFGGFTDAADTGETPGNGGSFSLDVGSVPDSGANLGPSLQPLNTALNAGGFTLQRLFRVRTGDVILDGSAMAHQFGLSADQGTITVTGTIDASGDQGGTVNVAGKPIDAFGNHGGTILLAAGQSVVLGAGANLSVAAANFDAAGKGGVVSLDAGSTYNGVIPSAADTRDPVTQSFLQGTTPVVDIQTGSTIDLSVAAASVSLAAGQKYPVPRSTVTGDLLVVDAAGIITEADGSTRAFSAGLLPPLNAGSNIVLNAAGKLTYLADGAKGAYTGILHLRAPQTTSTSAPDIQINPINGSLLNPSSIVIEGYQVFSPVAGYIDSVEADIDANGRAFASSDNTAAVLQRLTANWGKSAGQVNGALSLTAGAQLHVRPGAEVIGSSGSPTTDTLAFSGPGTTSTLSVPAGAMITLPSTTDASTGLGSNTITFSSGATLQPVNSGFYTYGVTSIGTSTSPAQLAVQGNAVTTITVGSGGVAAGKLISSVGGTIKLANGSISAFSAGPVPTLAPNSTVTFNDNGTIASAGTSAAAVSVTVRNTFAAGATVTVPANSSVALGSDGGSVTFATAGSLTWIGASAPTNKLAVKLPTGGGSFTTGAGAVVLATNGGSGAALTLNGSGSALTLAQGGSMVFPLGTTSATNVLQIGSSVPASTAAFTVTLKSAQGGTIKFPNTTTGSITTQKGGTQTLAKTTLDTTGVTLDGGGTISFPNGSEATQISSTAPGTIVLPPANLDRDGIAFASAGGTLTVPAGNTLAAGSILSTTGVTVTAPDGTVRTFAVPPGASKLALPALTPGSVIALANGSLSLSPDVVSALEVTVTRNLPAGTPTTIDANAVVKFATGGQVMTTSGDLSGLTITNTLLPGRATTIARGDSVQLANMADIVTVRSDSAFTVSGTSSLALALAADNSTSTKVSYLSGSGAMLAAVQAGTYTTSGATSIVAPAPAGNLTLAGTWDLSSYRYGPNASAIPGSGEPGILTLRAPGNLTFNFKASLSDGFGPAPAAANGGLWQALLLPAGSQSWTYQLVAGADLTGADFHALQPLANIGAGSGSILVGAGSGALPTATSGANVSRSVIIPQFYQTIRTGTGDIDMSAGRDLQLLDPLATIYTAGSAVPDSTTVATANDFDLPQLNAEFAAITPFYSSTVLGPYYPAQYSLNGGNVTIQAQNDIARYVQSGTTLNANSSKEMPTNWLYRRGEVGPDGLFSTLAGTADLVTEIQSTSWWVDYSNFFADVGALGGGNVSMTAGRNVTNVDASVATNARMSGKNAAGNAVAPNAAQWVELGGGDLSVRAGKNIDGGVYYVERGNATLRAGGSIVTNSTRTATAAAASTLPSTWLPTTLFLGKGQIDINAVGDVDLGPIANPFWLPQGANNRVYEKTYFTTFAPTDSVTVASLGGSITIQDRPDTATGVAVGSAAGLLSWYYNEFSALSTSAAASQPWLRLAEVSSGPPITAIWPFQTAAGVMPSTLKATAFAGDINLVGYVTLAPSSQGTVELMAAGTVNGLGVNGVTAGVGKYGSAVINLSDADPNRLPSITAPISLPDYSQATYTSDTVLNSVNVLFDQTGETDLSLEQKLALHGQAAGGGPLHLSDTSPVRIYAADGDISALTLYSGKSARVVASNDVTDVAFYVQNVNADDVSLVAAGRDVIAYDPSSPLRLLAGSNLLTFTVNDSGPAAGKPTDGDIQVSGPGTLEVLAGRNLTLGSGSNPKSDGTAAGITSIGFVNNPALAQVDGADIVAVAGVQDIYTPAAAMRLQSPGLATTSVKFADFIDQFLDPDTAGPNAQRYLPLLGQLMGLATKDAAAIWSALGYRAGQPVTERQAMLVISLFQQVLRDAGRDYNDLSSPDHGSYRAGFAAIQALFPGSPVPTADDIASTNPPTRPPGAWDGQLSMATREIKTFEGGNVSLLAPGGGLTIGRPTDPQKPDQGVLTERGGDISIYAADSVNVGTSRIFTLRGGNEIVWSTWGNIAAGSGSKTVFSAPPTRVLVDPQSADVKNDLAGLATGSGIGVLATLSDVQPGDVDLIAPIGAVDAGDAGIRSSGNLNLAARVVLNAGNISVGGTTAGAPPPPAAPNLGGLTAASNASAAQSSAASELARQTSPAAQVTELPSLFDLDVLGYGGGDEDETPDGSGIVPGSSEDDEKRRKRHQPHVSAP